MGADHGFVSSAPASRAETAEVVFLGNIIPGPLRQNCRKKWVAVSHAKTLRCKLYAREVGKNYGSPDGGERDSKVRIQFPI